VRRRRPRCLRDLRTTARRRNPLYRTRVIPAAARPAARSQTAAVPLAFLAATPGGPRFREKQGEGIERLAFGDREGVELLFGRCADVLVVELDATVDLALAVGGAGVGGEDRLVRAVATFNRQIWEAGEVGVRIAPVAAPVESVEAGPARAGIVRLDLRGLVLPE